MHKIIDEGTGLFYLLRETAARGTQDLINAGVYSSLEEGPDVEKIEAILKPFLDQGQHTRLPDQKLEWIVDHQAVQTATAFQALGSAEIALLWYKIGQYGWRGQAHWYAGDILDLDWDDREGPAFVQENPAICAALAGNIPHATQLFEWIAQNRFKTDQEIQLYEKARAYNSIWQSLGYLVFALLCLGDRWPEVSRLSEIGRRAILKTRKAGYPKDFREPQLLIDISWHLSTYFLDPSHENKTMAVDSLRLDKMHDRENFIRMNMLKYFFTLGCRYPELNPYPLAGSQPALWRPSAGAYDAPPNREAIQRALDEIFRQAEKQRKISVRVSSIDLHLRVGGYPRVNHRLNLCCQVMRDNLNGGGKIIGQTLDPDSGWLEIVYDIPRMK
jgi:hypothetical protein